MVALACLVMAAVFVVAGWRQASGRTGRRETTSHALVAGLIPPLVVTGVILSGAGRMGDVRLALEAVSVGTDTLDRAGFTIGGDPARDGVVVPGLHAGAVRVTRTPEGAARLTFRRPAAGAPVAGVASIDGGRSFLGAVEIADGDPVGAAGRRLVRQGDHLLGAQGEAGRALKGSGTGPSALFPLAYH
ncbi:MAG TPA: hypothetical protein VGB49_05660, partial [Caulobacteraceae bacterium]